MRINPYKLFVGSFIPNWLMSRSELTSSAKLVYARLAQYAGSDGKAFPKRETIAEELGLSLGMVKLGLKELKDYRLIETRQRGLTQSNEYYFLAHKWMELDLPDGQPNNQPDGQPASHIRESVKRINLKEKIPPSANSPKVLDPEIKEVADRLFNGDRVRFKRLIAWIKTQERNKVPVAAVAAALRKFEPFADSVGNEWWPYLSKLADKAGMDYWAEQHIKEHESRKHEPIGVQGRALLKSLGLSI